MSSITDFSKFSFFSILELPHFSHRSAITSTTSSGSFVTLVAPLCPFGAPRFLGAGEISFEGLALNFRKLTRNDAIVKLLNNRK